MAMGKIPKTPYRERSWDNISPPKKMKKLKKIKDVDDQIDLFTGDVINPSKKVESEDGNTDQ